MSNLWWLSASSEQLRQARTCQVCGCGDADIDLGLCFDCYSVQYRHNQMQEAQQDAYYAEMEAAYYREQVEAIQNTDGDGI